MMTGKVCMITGANDGIGKATAIGLAKQKAEIIMVCRDKSRGLAAREEIIEKSGHKHVDLYIADFASFTQVREMASRFKEKYDRLHVLINNAGAFHTAFKLTEDGHEMQFQVNHLAPFLLTNLLMETLKKSAPARIINVSSDSHYRGKINFDDMSLKANYNGRKAYSQSKLANVLFTYELARQHPKEVLTANALHPGVVKTMIAQKNSNFLINLAWELYKPFMTTLDKGAESSVYLASSHEVEGVTGKYYEKCRDKRSSDLSYDQEAGKRLWKLSEEMTGLK